MEAYSILGINKYSSEEAIRQAYKRCLLKSHPDHGGSNDEFNAVRLAYIQVKNNYVKNKIIIINLTVKLDQLEMRYCQGETSGFMYDNLIVFDVFVPKDTKFGDTLVVKNILPDTILKITFKEYNE
jgi:hypothetical protein